MQKNIKNFSKNLEVVRSKFSKRQLKKILDLAVMVNWKQDSRSAGRQLREMTQQQNMNYIWMVGSNPTYFIQYQVDSYTILKIYEKCVIVWKPKYLQYPSVVPLSQFPQNLKPSMKAFSIQEQENFGEVSEDLIEKINTYVTKFYAMHFFSFKQQEFETNLVTQLKHYVSRYSKVSYWHCVFDDHFDIDVSSRKSLYLRFRIKGAKDKYDKDLIIFSHQGRRQSYLRGKSLQVISFLAMLMIFVAMISCSGDQEQGICVHRDKMLISGAAVMMGLMGLRVANRATNKKKLQEKIKEQ